MIAHALIQRPTVAWAGIATLVSGGGLYFILGRTAPRGAP
jgi:hypothetical protein